MKNLREPCTKVIDMRDFQFLNKDRESICTVGPEEEDATEVLIIF